MFTGAKAARRVRSGARSLVPSVGTRPYRFAVRYQAGPRLSGLPSLPEEATASLSPEERREAVRLLYRRAARGYDVARDLWARGLGREIEAAVDHLVQEYAPQARRVLDLGCGTGANLARLIRLGHRGFSYTGVDMSEAMLAEARWKFGLISGVQFLRLNLEGTDGVEPPYDLVISTYAFSHLGDPVKTLAKALGWVAPGGSLVLADFSESSSLVRPLLRPFESWFRFRCIPIPTSAAFRGWREKTILYHGLMTAIAWRRSGPWVGPQ